MTKKYKSVRTLMKHLRDNKGISIKGSTQKRQLEIIGYYHSYKAYRFYKDKRNIINFSSFKEIYELVEFEYKLKELFYSALMKIETGVRNVVLEETMAVAESYNIDEIIKKAIEVDETTSPSITKNQRVKKMKVKKTWNDKILKRYDVVEAKKDISLSYYVDQGGIIPFWVVFDKYMFGDLIEFYESLTFDAKNNISKKLGLGGSRDSQRNCLRDHMKLLKELRNAISHNNVIFDCRFFKGGDTADATNNVSQYLPSGITLSYKKIVDYVILCCFYFYKLGYKKREIKSFVSNFEKLYRNYHDNNLSVASCFITTSDLNMLSSIKNIEFY